MIEAAVIIVNWNGKNFLKECFDSLAFQALMNFKIFFVDNGSDDGSVEFLEENYIGKNKIEIEVIKLENNTGFSFANNLGIQKAFADENIKWVLILNNDAKLDQNFFAELSKCAKSYPGAGSIQPKVLSYYNPEKVDCAGILTSYDGVSTNRGFGADASEFNKEKEIFGANATAGLYAREALEAVKIKVGEYFDNDFRMYYEDADLAWRMRLAGFKSFYCPRAEVFHLHSATAKRVSGLKAYYLNRNRFYVIFKNFPLKYLLLALLLTPARYLIAPFRRPKEAKKTGEAGKIRKKAGSAGMILKAWLDVLGNLSSILAKRRIIRDNRRVSGKEINSWFQKYGAKFKKTF
jgi:hypothetical protein